MMKYYISGFTMKSLAHVFRTKQGKSTPFSFLSCSTIHTSEQPILILRHSDLDYAFDCIENVDEAVYLFRYMLRMKPIPSICDYHKLLNVVKMKHYSQAILMFKELSLLGCGVDEYHMGTLINCYANLKEVELGFPIVAHFLKRGYPPNIVSFNCFIKGFFLKGNVTEAVALFKNLVKDKSCEINEITIATVLYGLSKSGNICEAVDLILISEKNDWKLNVFCYNTVIDGLCNSRRLKDGMDILYRMSDRGIVPDVVTYNTFIYGLCSHGKLDFALSVFNDLPSKGVSPDVITYTVIIQGLLLEGLFLEAKEMLEFMERVCCFPNNVTYNIIVQACLQQLHLHNVHSINLLRLIVGRDFPLGVSTFFLLLGQVEVLRQMHTIYDDDVIYHLINKLIFSCAIHKPRDNNDESIMNSLIQKLR